MRGVIIAAGRGLRMGPFTDHLPKCLLPIAGRTLLEHTIANMRAVGCDEIVVIVGYMAHTINVAGVRYVTNDDFANNNILHSLMKARDLLNGPVLVSYADIWLEPWIFRHLIETPGDTVLVVDRDWRPYYEGRTEHPVTEAENVYLDDGGAVVRIGKQVDPDDAGAFTCGEFTGLWKMSAEGTVRFCAEFAAADARLDPLAPFQSAREWRKAYVADLLQELVDRGHRLEAALIERGWAELDTEQDYNRLTTIARRQRLATIDGSASKQ